MQQSLIFAVSISALFLAVSIQARNVPDNLNQDAITLLREKRTPINRATLLSSLGGVPANAGGEATTKPPAVPPRRPAGLPPSEDEDDFEDEDENGNEKPAEVTSSPSKKPTVKKST